jgi:hypothetical protein
MSGPGHKVREIPWLLIATIGGISAVILIAVLFFSGYIVAPPQEPGSGVPTPVKTVVTTLKPVSTAVTSTPTGTTPITTPVVSDTATVAVPSSGIYVKVDYIGAFSGTYTVNGVKYPVRSSGSRMFLLQDATGTVTAAFQKEDGTTKHSLTVGIYKDGKLLRSDSVSSAYGQVSVAADV